MPHSSPIWAYRNSIHSIWSVLDQTLDGIGLIDKNNELIYANDALFWIHGIVDDQTQNYLGNDWRNLYNEKGRAIINSTVLPAVQEKGYWQGETLLPQKTGQLKIVEMSLTLLDDGGMIGTARDITERKRIEQDAFNAQKMESLGRLAGGIAHDFNNTLAAIMGYAEMLRDDVAENRDLLYFVERIIQASLQSRETINQILMFSNRRKRITSLVNVCDVVQQAISMAQTGLPKTFVLTSSFPQIFMPVKSDFDALTRAILDLILNARDAYREDHGTIRLDITECPADHVLRGKSGPRFAPNAAGANTAVFGHIGFRDHLVEIKVTDEGCGMDMDTLNHAFEPFFTTKGHDNGTGMGLAALLGLVNTMGGGIYVETTPQKGTSVSMFLPIDDDTANKVREAATQDEKAPFYNARFTIMIIDDQELIRDMLSLTLKKKGFQTIAFDHAYKALAHLQLAEKRPDLIITDENMPGMLGTEFSTQIASDYPGLPIILISGYHKDDLITNLDHFPAIIKILHKPVERVLLYNAVIDGLKKAGIYGQ